MGDDSYFSIVNTTVENVWRDHICDFADSHILCHSRSNRSLVKTDVSQFLVLVGFLVQRLLHQLPGENVSCVFVVPAVGQIDMRLAHGGNGVTLPDVPGGGAESVRDGQPLTAGVRNTSVLAQLGQGLFLY